MGGQGWISLGLGSGVLRSRVGGEMVEGSRKRLPERRALPEGEGDPMRRKETQVAEAAGSGAYRGECSCNGFCSCSPAAALPAAGASSSPPASADSER